MAAPLTSAGGTRSWLGSAWNVASDLLIAVAIVWTLPLLLGVVAGLVGLLRRVM